MSTPPDSLLQDLDGRIRHALVTGDESKIEVLGYGEISCTIRLDDGEGAWACKRLPPFATRGAFDRYAAVFADYLEALESRGVHVVPSTLRTVSAEDAIIAYCVQPVLDASRLLPTVLRAASREEGEHHITALFENIERAVGDGVGLDAQISNWVVEPDGSLGYLDVTTPLLRDAEGRERLETDVFLASLPWALRGIVKTFLLKGIVDKYHDPRGVTMDVLGNLHKERLTDVLDAWLELANERVSPPITRKEVDAYYNDDARTWALLLSLRRIDRKWQMGVRGRTYPFLLPGPVER